MKNSQKFQMVFRPLDSWIKKAHGNYTVDLSIFLKLYGKNFLTHHLNWNGCKLWIYELSVILHDDFKHKIWIFHGHFINYIFTRCRPPTLLFIVMAMVDLFEIISFAVISGTFNIFMMVIPLPYHTSTRTPQLNVCGRSCYCES